MNVYTNVYLYERIYGKLIESQPIFRFVEIIKGRIVGRIYSSGSTMPDGFDPHVELERIHTLRELMTECRQRVPKVLSILDGMLDNPDAMTASEKMALCDMVWNRAYGKPRQHVMVSEGTNSGAGRVQVYIPDNGRANIPQKTIDVEAA